ncbi:MAG: esterase-like activity of phytase family protein [Allosphingosinicella sp.]
MKLTRNLNDLGQRGVLRAFFLLLALFLLVTIVPRPAPTPPDGPADATITATPVVLDERDPARRRVGSLVFLRGWDLNSTERRFGGISAIHVEGDRITAVSDTGMIFGFLVPRLAGAQPLRIEPLPRESGTDKRSYDTEAMLVSGDRVWLAFERMNGIARYRRGTWHLESAARPVLMRRWRRNSGPEGMVRLRDGRYLILSEGQANDDPFSAAVLLDGDPAEPGTRAHPLRYRRSPGYRMTDAALLPDGRLLVLNRRVSLFDGLAATLVIADTAGLKAGDTISGREIARLRPPLTVDNMEALAVSVEGGRTIVRIASDDNFMGMQRTLLLEFALDESLR